MAMLLPILLFILVAAAVSVGMIAAPRLLAPRKHTAVKEMPYESGMDPIHDVRRRFAVRFHLVAIAFLVFDVELLFLYPWAVATAQQGSGFRVQGLGQGEQRSGVTEQKSVAESNLSAAPRGIDFAVASGWVSDRGLVFGGAMMFILLVVLGFVYDWRKGVFQWR